MSGDWDVQVEEHRMTLGRVTRSTSIGSRSDKSLQYSCQVVQYRSRETRLKQPSSRLQLFLQEVLQRITILCKLSDPLVQLVKGHRVLKQCPAELGLAVDIGNLGNGLGLGSFKSISESDASSIRQNADLSLRRVSLEQAR